MDLKVQANYRRTCRTCLRVLESRKDLISIFDFDQTIPSKRVKFSEMLSSVSKHLFNEQDELPKRICVMCVNNIRSAFFFKSQAENSFNVLLRQLQACQLISSSSIKQEARQEISVPSTVLKSLLTTSNERSDLPLILAPRTIEDSEVSFEEDMLVEIEPPKIQEPYNSNSNGYDDEESYDDDIIEYDPVFSDDEIIEITPEQPHASSNGKSPDSGITADTSKTASPEDESSIAKSQLNQLQRFECNLCLKEMFSLKSLQRHKKNFHRDNNCTYCKRRFGSRVQLRLHTRFKHPQKYNEFRLNGQVNPIVTVEPIVTIPECSTCGAKFCEKEALYRHHGECDRKCIECGMKILRKDYYYSHLYKEHGIQILDQVSLECPFGCLDHFTSEKVLQDHVQRNHPEEKEEESVADTISDYADSTNNETQFMSCEQCGAKFPSKRSLTQHIAYKHKPGIVELPKTSNVAKYSREEFIDKFMVKKSFEYQRCIPCKKDIHRRSIGLHLRGKHAAAKSFVCELCDESFFRIDYRQRHMAHIHFNQYRCFDCEVQFDRAHKYDSHMAQHGVPVKNFKPEEGADRYDLSWNNMKYIEDSSTYDYGKEEKERRTSVLSTTSVQVVEVPLTREDFTNKYFSNVNDKSSQCTICQVKIMKSSIVSHLLWKHAVKKPLKCAFCNERVVKNTGRLNHMSRCHPNEYRCSVCTAQFTKHDNLASHMLDAHDITVTTRPSSGEEDDLSLGDVRFISQKNEDEIIEELETIDVEPDLKMDQRSFEEDQTDGSYKCQFCVKSFACSKNLQIHKSHKHKQEMIDSYTKQPYEDVSQPMTFEEFRCNFVESVTDSDIKCLVCDQLLKKKNFGNHIKSRHATSGAYKCAICPESFFRPEHRIQHMSSLHRGMFFCHTCNIQFYRNSRYAKHMHDMHDITVDNSDSYEVDLCLGDLKFVPLITKTPEEEQNASLPSIVHEPDPEPEPVEEQETEQSNSMDRDEFMTRYIRTLGKDTRRCIACDKNILKGSMYNHLMRFHAVTLPYKCPFCDLRLERSQYRLRHLQLFHPDGYKCYECGLQFELHAKFTEHMLVEHNSAVSTPKAPGEEKDLSSFDVTYVPQKSDEESFWDEDETSQGNDTKQTPSTSKGAKEFLKPSIKEEPKDDDHLMMHSIFGSESLLEEKPRKVPSGTAEYSYNDFKNRFMLDVNSGDLKCLPCDRVIVKTSGCAHMRLWHAITMCYNCEICNEGFQRTDYRQRHMKFVHPDDFKCSYCDLQFHRSVLYKQHMMETHKIKVDIKEKKKKDDIDVPLENMKFIEHVPDSVRLRNEGETARRGGRPSTVIRDPINPEGGGMTYEEFCEDFLKMTGDSFTCTICHTSMSKFYIKKHLKRCHATSKSFFCELCSEGFTRPDERIQHMNEKHHDNLRCFHCDLQFYLSSNYADHMQNTHKMVIRVVASKPKCEVDVPIERLRFVAEKLDSEGSQIVMKRRMSVVPSANSSLDVTTSPGLALKKSKHTFDNVSDDIELTREQFYGKFFRSIKYAKGSGDVKTKCLACQKIFSTKNRKFHAMHNHATFRPLKCELCKNRFFLSNKRLAHMANRHPTDYKCKICVIQFARAFNYASHMLHEHQTKVNVPKFDLEEYDVPANRMRFTKKSTAVRELKRLSLAGSAPDVVEATDSEASSFLSLPQDPLKCSECDLEFDSSRALRIHMRNHSSGIGFQKVLETIAKSRENKILDCIHECDVCHKKFSAVFALNAHKKFKHKLEPIEVKKRKSDKPKYECECDICDFTSHRRDYVEHHVKAAHKPEFHCRYCTRIISNYNYFVQHLAETHPRAKETAQLFECDGCKKAFRTLESMEQHKNCKHDADRKLPENYCETCGVSYSDATGLEVHFGNHLHKGLVSFLEARSGAVSCNVVKSEPTENESVEVLESNGSDEDPFRRMLEQRFESSEEPPTKRPRFTMSRTSRLSIDEDKLDYLKYLQMHNGVYKCGLCGKLKTIRKHMLHHLKQHKEVPTYSCDRCSEKFVFKRKYDKHLQEHLEQDAAAQKDDAMEHPKFQENSKPNPNEIACQICNLTFKLTIMLNRHNSTWHGSDNPDKDLSMEMQKAKKEEEKQEVAVIKLLRCKHCLEAFIKPFELKEHLRVKHNSESIDQPVECEPTTSADLKSGDFPCDKCKIVFKEKKFLENHQKFFCMHRQSKGDEAMPAINEQ